MKATTFGESFLALVGRLAALGGCFTVGQVIPFHLVWEVGCYSDALQLQTQQERLQFSRVSHLHTKAVSKQFPNQEVNRISKLGNYILLITFNLWFLGNLVHFLAWKLLGNCFSVQVRTVIFLAVLGYFHSLSLDEHQTTHAYGSAVLF